MQRTGSPSVQDHLLGTYCKALASVFSDHLTQEEGVEVINAHRLHAHSWR